MSVFSDILVSKVSEEVLPDWTVRTLKVEKVLQHIKLHICREFDVKAYYADVFLRDNRNLHSLSEF